MFCTALLWFLSLQTLLRILHLVLPAPQKIYYYYYFLRYCWYSSEFTTHSLASLYHSLNPHSHSPLTYFSVFRVTAQTLNFKAAKNHPRMAGWPGGSCILQVFFHTLSCVHLI